MKKKTQKQILKVDGIIIINKKIKIIRIHFLQSYIAIASYSKDSATYRRFTPNWVVVTVTLRSNKYVKLSRKAGSMKPLLKGG